MGKKIYKLKKNRWQELSRLLSLEFGLPITTSSFALYFYRNNEVFELNFINSRCFFRVNNSARSTSKVRGEDFFESKYPLEIENKNIKTFLRFLTTVGLEEAFVGDELVNMNFNIDTNNVIDIILNTPIGDILVFRGSEFKEEYIEYVEEELTSLYIQNHFENNIKREKIFNNFGMLNSKIIIYGDRHGIYLKSSGVTNIKDMISARSNDYRIYEDVYETILNIGFSSHNHDEDLINYFKPISIIIPSFNSENTLIKTLYSIESQKINIEQKKLIDVIIIDDGSRLRLFDSLNKYIEKLSFPVRFVRLETNAGLSNARNIGVRLSKYPRLLFIDSDIILPDNYVLEHSVCLQFFPNCLFISMKKNIDKDDKNIDDDKILKGLKVPAVFDDKRVFREFKVDEVWGDKIKIDSAVESLSETDLYKNFGYGRTILGYDLPSVVIGHNMSLNKDMFERIGGFSNNFDGWGMEDTLFGAKFIAKGGFIVPLMRTGVYHINHPPRSGSEEKRKEELEKNLRIYKNIIEQKCE